MQRKKQLAKKHTDEILKPLIVKRILTDLAVLCFGLELQKKPISEKEFRIINSLLKLAITHFTAGKPATNENLVKIFVIKDFILAQNVSEELRNDFSLTLAQQYLTLLYLVSDEVKKDRNNPDYSERVVTLLRVPMVCREIIRLPPPTLAQVRQLTQLGWISMTDPLIKPKDRQNCIGYLHHLLLIQLTLEVAAGNLEAALKNHRLVRAIHSSLSNDQHAYTFALHNSAINLAFIAEELARNRRYEAALIICKQALFELQTYQRGIKSNNINPNRLPPGQKHPANHFDVSCDDQINQLKKLTSAIEALLKEEGILAALFRCMPQVKSTFTDDKRIQLTFTNIEAFNQFLRQVKALDMTAEVNLTTLEFIIPKKEFKQRYWFLLCTAANNLYTPMDQYSWENDLLDKHPLLHPVYGASAYPIYFTSMENTLLNNLPNDAVALEFEAALYCGLTTKKPCKEIPTVIEKNAGEFEISLQTEGMRHTLFGKSQAANLEKFSNTPKLIIWSRYKAE